MVSKEFFNYVKRGTFPQVEQYLRDNPHTDLNQRDSWGRTPVMLAALRGDIKIVDLLIRNKADIHVIDNQGGSLIYFAASGGNIHLLEYLMSYNLSPKVQVTKEGYYQGVTPIHVAAKNNQIFMVKYLLDEGCDPNLVTSRGETPSSLTASPEIKAVIAHRNKLQASMGTSKHFMLSLSGQHVINKQRTTLNVVKAARIIADMKTSSMTKMTT